MIIGAIKDKFKIATITFIILICILAYFQYQKIIELSSAIEIHQTALKEQSEAIDKAVKDISNIIKLNEEADKRISNIQENFKNQSAALNQYRGGKLNEFAAKDKAMVESGINATVNNIMQSISDSSRNKKE